MAGTRPWWRVPLAMQHSEKYRHTRGNSNFRRILGLAIASCALLLESLPAAADVEVKDEGGKLRIEIDGQLFTQYAYSNERQPHWYPLYGPGNVPMTRRYPQENVPGEAQDHPHHTSLWFSHGRVNGVDFWQGKEHSGRIVHRGFDALSSGKDFALIRSRNDWLDGNGELRCTDVRTVRIYRTPASERVMDFEVTLHASQGELTLGDTKEGTMALRIAESMRLAPNEFNAEKPPGRIVNSEGERDDATWGKRAKWVDYSGQVSGREVGVAMFDHPSNPRHPTWWQVRGYGLFAANPFGRHDFEDLKDTEAGNLVVPAGESVTFRYRIYLHEGDAERAKVAARYQQYVQEWKSPPPPEVSDANQSSSKNQSLPEIERAALPLYKTIPAAKASELTAATKVDPYSYRTWSRSNADASNTRYSSLSQIDRSNIKQLRVAWTYRSGDGNANIQANPLIADGVMFAPTAGGNIVAIDAKSGAERWRFSPRAPSAGSPLTGYGPATHGLVYWQGDARNAPRLFFMFDGYLHALDPKKGEPINNFGVAGRVASTKGAGASKFIGTAAPAIYANVIVAPNQNVVDAYDVVTGEKLWHFNTLTYPVADPDADNGGNIWAGIAMDSARGIVFAATGNPYPGYVGIDRPGDNRHSNSVIALDAPTGRLLWSFQYIAHDVWDLDIPAPPNLVTVQRSGRLVDAVAQVTKQGNTLLLDRVTGKPIFPFRLKRAPVSRLPGERTAPYQPALELPEPFARQVFTLDEVTRITPAAHAYVLKQIRNANFGWFVPSEEGKPTVIYPGTQGGAEWSGAAFDPVKHVLYVSSNEIPTLVTVSRAGDSPAFQTAQPGAQVFQSRCADCHGEQGRGRGVAPSLSQISKRLTEGDFLDILERGKGAMPPMPLEPEERQVLTEFLFHFERVTREEADSKIPASKAEFVPDGVPRLRDDRGYPGVKPPWGTLNAINLDTGKLVWKVPLGEHEELTRQGVPQTGTVNYGGAMVTAGGLVFCAGTMDLKIRAFDSRNGQELWAYKLPFGGYAPPATYEVDGRQYVVIAATGGGKLGGELGDAYVAFALPRE